MSTSRMWLVFSFPLFALLITDGGCFEEMDLSGFTQSLMDLANNTLGVQIMQVPWAAWLLLAPCCLKHFSPCQTDSKLWLFHVNAGCCGQWNASLGLVAILQWCRSPVMQELDPVKCDLRFIYFLAKKVVPPC